MIKSFSTSPTLVGGRARTRRRPQAVPLRPQPSAERRRRAVRLALGGGLLASVAGLVVLAGWLASAFLVPASPGQDAAPDAVASTGVDAPLVETLPRPAPTGVVAPRVAARAPELDLTGQDGRTLRLADYAARALLVSFWDSGCAVCQEDARALNALARELSGLGVTVLAVNVGEDAETAARWLRERGPDLALALDPERAAARRYEVSSLPTSVFIDGSGTVRDRVAGPLTQQRLRNGIASALDGRNVVRPAPIPLVRAFQGEGGRVVGTVDGSAITLAEVDRRIDLELALAYLRGEAPPDLTAAERGQERRARERTMLERLADERVLAPRAAAAGVIIPDADVQAEVRRQEAELGLQPGELAPRLEALGSSLDELERSLRARLAFRRFTEEVVLAGKVIGGNTDFAVWLNAARAEAKVQLEQP